MKKKVLSIILLFSIAFAFGQTTISQQDFDGSVPILGYTGGTLTTATGPFPNSPNYVSATTGLLVNNTTEVIEFDSVDVSTYTNIGFSFRLASFAGTNGNGADGADYVIVSVSTDGGATYSEELEINGNSNAKWGFSGVNAGTAVATNVFDGDNTPTNFTPSGGGNRTTDGYSYISMTNLPSSTNLRVRIEMDNNSVNESWVIDDVILEGNPPSGPTIILNPNTLNGLDYTIGSGPSTEQTFTAEGFLLTSDLVITAPTNFEISTISGGSFGNTINLSPTTGTVPSTIIYTRLIPGLAINSYTGSIVATSDLAITKNTVLNGEVLAPLADVVITEISYNASGGDEDWIEICNTTGDTQDLSGYIINDGATIFTFPSYSTITSSSCITIALGSDGDGSYNNNCPFIPDYGANPSSSSINYLGNTSGFVTLFASDGATVIDTVIYDDGDGADGNGATLHVIDASLDNSDTSINWQEVSDGGSPGTNALTSPCSAPELQLLDDTNTDQTCGYTLDFGSQATGFNTDLTFNINNEGSLDLDISTLIFSGTNPGDFSIISPITPFTITPGNTQIVTIRFSPSSVAVKNAILTITNNDADENTCTILLEGLGTTPEQEINVEGNIGAYPDISNGDITPIALDNTLFAAQNIGDFQTKSFRIQNNGTANLDINSIIVEGTNPGDFTVSSNPSPFTVLSMQDPPGVFEITFQPIASGTRTAIISISNNDLDENPYTFMVQGNGSCNTTSITITPDSGPINTIVTVNSSDLTSATATVNGIVANVNHISDTVMEVTIPINATTGNIEVTNDLGCSATENFTVLDASGSCNSSNFSDLIISEVYDSNTGNSWYMELYNPTSSTIDLNTVSSDYQIERYGTIGDTTPTRTIDLTGSIAPNSTYTIKIGDASPNPCASISYDFTEVGGGINENDQIRLIKNGVNHDLVNCPSQTGYSILRILTATGPTTIYNASDWSTNTTENCSDLGVFNIPNNSKPTVLDLVNTSDCSITSFNYTATAGNSGTLTYQWFYNDGVSTNWTLVSNSSFTPGIIIGETTNSISITGFDLSGYQFYGEVTEDGTCSQVTNTEQATTNQTTWTAGAWDNGIPNINISAIINDDYSTSINGSFSACTLTINNANTLNVNNNTYVEIENETIVEGNIIVDTQGNFVQNNNTSSFTLNSGATSTVNKLTTPIYNVNEYTYWSSPVTNTIIEEGLSASNPNRRYVFNAANYLDLNTEIGNTNTFTIGIPDGIDDNGDDWAWVAGNTVMTPAIGYISMHSPTSFISGNQHQYTFEGAFNTGIITTPIAFNGANGDEDWNLIGNPYPSAIDANAFLTANSSIIQGVAYLWSHNTPANYNASGNQAANFTNSDYAIITLGSGNTAGGDTIIPDNYIPSGQSFFVQGIANGNVTFNNSFRMADTTSNNQFFRAQSSTIENKLWVNLTSDVGLFHQILIAYVNGATNGKDSKAYDANRTLNDENLADIFTFVPNDDDKLAVQGKAPQSLTINEVIPVGFSSKIESPTIFNFSIAQMQGPFFETNTVYLIDYLNNYVHNLSGSDYQFTSDSGEFKERFEIVFNPNTLSVTNYNLDEGDITIVELGNDQVKFSVSNSLKIKYIKIIDPLGKQVYDYNCNSASETINLERLSQSLYFAKIKLSNGVEITKKAIKK
ncbi:choice-of-anchor D domain-containing protein [uncultured Olleya sp.]|uniref:choice-of-anchor D domain-containing protein n=1 Tax=uncultured Olleya sp. TaxID=757243 RepID=UPI002595DE37|nr:choice-of-anchor D domain-containing protein [uncultured Olleya sp.]